MNEILRPITADGMVGFDAFNQLNWKRQEGQYTVSSIIADVREKICVICNHGWELTGPSMGDQVRWQLIDDWVHETCLIRHSGLRERAEFQSAMIDARSDDVGVRFKMDTVPNRYWGDKDPYGKKPWYRFKLLDYPVWFIIGSRKRVVNIEAIPNGGDLSWWKAAEDVFAAEDVTKEFGPKRVMLHAWNEAKVKEYVAKLAWFAEGRTRGGDTALSQKDFDAMTRGVPYYGKEVLGYRWKSPVHPALRKVSHVMEWNLGELVEPEGCTSFHVTHKDGEEVRFGIRWTRISVMK